MDVNVRFTLVYSLFVLMVNPVKKGKIDLIDVNFKILNSNFDTCAWITKYCKTNPKFGYFHYHKL